MRILMAENEVLTGEDWAGHLRGAGMEVDVTSDADNAISLLNRRHYDLLVIGLVDDSQAGPDLAQYAAYRQPEAMVIFVSGQGCHANGTVFELASNVRALIGKCTAPADVAAMAEHFCRTAA